MDEEVHVISGIMTNKKRMAKLTIQVSKSLGSRRPEAQVFN